MRNAGLMGHNVVVCGTVRGERQKLAECQDMEWARRFAARHADKNPAIYRREANGKPWVQVNGGEE